MCKLKQAKSVETLLENFNINSEWHLSQICLCPGSNKLYYINIYLHTSCWYCSRHIRIIVCIVIEEKYCNRYKNKNDMCSFWYIKEISREISLMDQISMTTVMNCYDLNSTMATCIKPTPSYFLWAGTLSSHR